MVRGSKGERCTALTTVSPLRATEAETEADSGRSDHLPNRLLPEGSSNACRDLLDALLLPALVSGAEGIAPLAEWRGRAPIAAEPGHSRVCVTSSADEDEGAPVRGVRTCAARHRQLRAPDSFD